MCPTPLAVREVQFGSSLLIFQNMGLVLRGPYTHPTRRRLFGPFKSSFGNL